MSYTPYTWQSGDTVTASRLNNIEQGVASAGGLVVNVLYDDIEDAMYLDKNYTEITTAILSGSSVVFIWENTDTSPGDEERKIYPFHSFGISDGNYYVCLIESNNEAYYGSASSTGRLIGEVL